MGYRYQEHIFHCSACSHGINDGSERLFTGLHTAPKGEFRRDSMHEGVKPPQHDDVAADPGEGSEALLDTPHNMQVRMHELSGGVQLV